MTTNQGTITGGGTPYGLDRKHTNDHRTDMIPPPAVAHPVVSPSMVPHSAASHPMLAHPVVAHLFRGGEKMLANITNPTAEAVGHPKGMILEGAPQLAVGAFDSEENPHRGAGHPMMGSAGAEFNAEYRYLNAATCPDCGSGMVRLGGCFSCPACGFSSCEL